MPVVEKQIIQDVSKMTVGQVKTAYKQLAAEYKKISEDTLYCHHCGKFHPKTSYYKSAKTASGVIPICKACLYTMATNYDSKTKTHNVTQESIMLALRMADLPYIYTLYESCLTDAESEMSTKTEASIWTTMIRMLQSLPQYAGLGWESSEFKSEHDDLDNANCNKSSLNNELVETYAANKRTVISALGYDPFSTASDTDKPLMYSKLAGLLDESTNEDEVKLGACVEITHSFNQAEKYNSVINELQQTAHSCAKNAGLIKTLAETKNKIFTSMLALAKENGITINSSNKNTKGANTWTGTIKEMKEMKLREAEVNAFDVGTAAGMRQVAELSIGAILKQISLDENDYTEMIKTQREIIDDINDKLLAAEEEARLFKRENKDLKDFLRDKKLIDNNGEVIL